jgi:hypothetical protein
VAATLLLAIQPVIKQKAVMLRLLDFARPAGSVMRMAEHLGDAL